MGLGPKPPPASRAPSASIQLNRGTSPGRAYLLSRGRRRDQQAARVRALSWRSGHAQEASGIKSTRVKSETMGSPASRMACAPPSSRSISETTPTTCAPAMRRFSTAWSVECPVVTTSSRTTTGMPGTRDLSPSTSLFEPWFFASLRMYNASRGSPRSWLTNDTALARGQPPSSTPATASHLGSSPSASKRSSPTSAWPSAVRTACLQSIKNRFRARRRGSHFAARRTLPAGGREGERVRSSRAFPAKLGLGSFT